MIEKSVMVAVIIGVSELVKKLGVPPKFLPLVNVGLGVIGSFFLHDGELVGRIVQGVIIGLSASGLYDQKKILKKG